MRMTSPRWATSIQAARLLPLALLIFAPMNLARGEELITTFTGRFTGSGRLYYANDNTINFEIRSAWHQIIGWRVSPALVGTVQRTRIPPTSYLNEQIRSSPPDFWQEPPVLTHRSVSTYEGGGSVQIARVPYDIMFSDYVSPEADNFTGLPKLIVDTNYPGLTYGTKWSFTAAEFTLTEWLDDHWSLIYDDAGNVIGETGTDRTAMGFTLKFYAVPEPASLSLIALACGALGWPRLRKQQNK